MRVVEWNQGVLCDPVPLIGVQLGGSLARKLSSNVSSIMSEGDAASLGCYRCVVGIAMHHKHVTRVNDLSMKIAAHSVASSSAELDGLATSAGAVHAHWAPTLRRHGPKMKNKEIDPLSRSYSRCFMSRIRSSRIPPSSVP